MNVVASTGMNNRSHRLNSADPMRSAVLMVSLAWIDRKGPADNTYPDMTKKIATAKCPPENRMRIPGKHTKSVHSYQDSVCSGRLRVFQLTIFAIPAKCILKYELAPHT
jgi:hypothetical protein